MRTWDDYKKHVKTADPESGKDIEEAENISIYVSQGLGFSFFAAYFIEKEP